MSRPARVESREHAEQRSLTRQVWTRVLVFLIGLHVLAGFVMLLFYVGHR